MTLTADIRIILNPASAAGKTFQRTSDIVRALERGLPGRCECVMTDKPGAAVSLAEDATRDGIPMIVAVGGDGTIHEIVNGMMRASSGGIPETSLGIIGSGSGNGFAQSLGLPADLHEQARLLAGGRGQLLDLGIVACQTGPGGDPGRYFVNECQVGIGADVVSRATGRRKAAGGLLGYGLATLSSLFGYPAARVHLQSDGDDVSWKFILGLSIGNGHLTGGGMALTPAAVPNDGLLDVLVIHGMSVCSRLCAFPRIYTGAHLASSHFDYRKVHRLVITGEEHLPLAADGELVGRTPCSITIVPAALRVVCSLNRPGEIS